MANRFVISVLTIGLLLVGPAVAQQGGGGQRPPGMELTSTAFDEGTDIPLRFSQAAPGAAPGEGTSPDLTWKNVPEGTQSFVLHFHDLEVTRQKTTEDQIQWLVWNIPGTTTSMPEGVARGPVLPDGSFQISATGPVYRGPGAPASGPRHHYVFELYALDTKIDVQPSDDAFETRRKVMEAMQGHIIGKAVLAGLFKRPS